MYTVCDMYIPDNAEILDMVFKESGIDVPIENGCVIRVREGDNFDLGEGRYPTRDDPVSELALVYSPEYSPGRHLRRYDEYINEAGMVSRTIRLRRGMKFSLSAEGFNFDPATAHDGALVYADSNGKFSLCNTRTARQAIGRMREEHIGKGCRMYSVAIINDGNPSEVDNESKFLR